MTGGFGSDAITTVLPVAGEAQLITRNMPGDDGALVINTATSGTVLLGTSSSINPNTSVPLPAGASVQWVDDGELWAYLGPDGTTPVTLVVTDRASSWQPSPEAVGLAVATQLLATGVPSVLLEESVLASVTIPAGSSLPPVDISAYASLVFSASAFNSITHVALPVQLSISQMDPLGNNAMDRDVLIGVGQANARVAVSGPTLFLFNSGTDPVIVTMFAGNRAPAARFDARQHASGSVGWDYAYSSVIAGGRYPLFATDVNAVLQGLVYARFALTSNTAAQGYFVATDGTGLDQYLCEFAELNSTLAASKLCAMPARPVVINFVCTAAGTTGMHVQMTSAQL